MSKDGRSGGKHGKGDGASKKQRRRRGKVFWGVLAGICAILAIVFVVATSIAGSFSSIINTYMGVTEYEVVEGDSDADDEYYTSDYTEEELIAYESEIAEQVEAEGAVLLKNENDALPLSEGDSVSLFSHSSVDLVYGGTGSGNVDTSTAPTLMDALTEVGLDVNQTLWDFYSSDEITEEYTRIIPSGIADDPEAIADYGANEVPWDLVEEAAADSFATYGDAAIFVISRSGGEGADLPAGETSQGLDYTSGVDGNYLELSEEELGVLAGLKELKDAGTIQKIVVLINSSNAIELDFLDEALCGVDYGVDAVLWIGDPGQVGVNAVADILVGNVNPSGSLADTYCYDNLTSPAMQAFYPTQYEGADDYGLQFQEEGGRSYYDVNNSYSVYVEGIYVGYRYYETRYEDVVMGTSGVGDYDYSSTVAYSFGYGLSYTTFDVGDLQMSYDEDADEFTATVTVTNTGDVAGKKTVQLYFQSPYTDYDVQNGIEKASIELCGYAKTDELAPGESQMLTITVNREELRTFDTNGYGTYIMDAGTYYFAVGNGAHEALNNVLAAKGYGVEDGMDAKGDTALTWSWELAELDATSFSTSSTTGEEIEALFGEADPNTSSLDIGEVTYVSRSDWEGTWPTGTVTLTANDALVEALEYTTYDADTYDGEYADAEMPTLGADNGISLADLIGADYDDPLWDDLLDQLTFDEMLELITIGFHRTAALESVDKPATKDENGPTGLTASVIGGESYMCYSSEDVMAATMNDELIAEMGACIGEDCLAAGYSGLYGPGANTHRTPYGGRNYEYYSEDSFLAGSICASEVAGIQSKGVYVYLKHFALNDAETYRMGTSVWANEQTIREIYLEAFEKAFTDGDASGVMNSFTRVGTEWCGESYEMMTQVLRDEWGCEGAIITDMSAFSNYMDVADGLLAGTDLWDNMMTSIQTENLAAYEDDPVIVSAMREASHRILYTTANSNAMNGISSGDEVRLITPWWEWALRALVAVFAVLAVLCVVKCVRTPRREKRMKA